jgi:hypothetical protein
LPVNGNAQTVKEAGLDTVFMAENYTALALAAQV